MPDRDVRYQPAGTIKPGMRIIRRYLGLSDLRSSAEVFTVDHVGRFKNSEGQDRVSIKCGDRVFALRPDDPVEVAPSPPGSTLSQDPPTPG